MTTRFGKRRDMECCGFQHNSRGGVNVLLCYTPSSWSLFRIGNTHLCSVENSARTSTVYCNSFGTGTRVLVSVDDSSHRVAYVVPRAESASTLFERPGWTGNIVVSPSSVWLSTEIVSSALLFYHVLSLTMIDRLLGSGRGHGSRTMKCIPSSCNILLLPYNVQARLSPDIFRHDRFRQDSCVTLPRL